MGYVKHVYMGYIYTVKHVYMGYIKHVYMGYIYTVKHVYMGYIYTTVKPVYTGTPLWSKVCEYGTHMYSKRCEHMTLL